MILYPAIDLINGKCVRLAQGDFARVTKYELDPIQVAEGYKRSGATAMHVVDLDGARAKTPLQSELIGKLVSATGLTVQSGGGIRTVEDAFRLIDNGISQVVIGSLAVKNPSISHEIFTSITPARFTLAVDVRVSETGTPLVATEGWSVSERHTLWELLDEYSKMGLQRLLCTDIARDGMLRGPNLELYLQIRERYPQIELQASGGVGSLKDIQELKKAGIPAVIIGRALFEGKFTLKEALAC